MKAFFMILIYLVMGQWAWGQEDIIEISDTTIYKVVKEMPSFPGCEDLTTSQEKKVCADKKMLEFIYSNIIYPKSLDHISLESKVLISFIVEKDGSLSNFKIIQGDNEALNKEALRVVQMMPNFIPGKNNGKVVRVYFQIPIQICLASGISALASHKELVVFRQREEGCFPPEAPFSIWFKVKM